jgi:excisionase family DNA binding protein
MKPTGAHKESAGSNTGSTIKEPLGPESPLELAISPEPGQPHNDDREAPNEPFLSVDEAAALLRVNRKTAYEAVKTRRMPGVVRLGRIIRIRRDALLRWGQ